ncbi:MAG: porin family protein [Lentisphaerae bacterium]|nr:porin family protein [Lentisphaerota bacterium]
MRRLIPAAFGLVLLAAVARAGDVKLGGHAAYLVGGDLATDTLGFGAQAQAYVNDALSLELAGTRFTDDNAADITIDHLAFAATVRLSGHPAEGIEVYAGGGANYNQPYVTAPAKRRGRVTPAIGYHYCGGIALAILQHLDLFAEYRGSSVSFEQSLGKYDSGLVFVGLLLPL